MLSGIRTRQLFTGPFSMSAVFGFSVLQPRSYLQFPDHLPGIVLRLYPAKCPDNRSFLVNEIRGTLNPHHGLSEHGPFLPDIVCLQYRPVRIRQKREGQSVFFHELSVGCHAVRVYAQHHSAFFRVSADTGPGSRRPDWCSRGSCPRDRSTGSPFCPDSPQGCTSSRYGPAEKTPAPLFPFPASLPILSS